MKKRIGSSLLLWLLITGLCLGSKGVEREYDENSMAAVSAAEDTASGAVFKDKPGSEAEQVLETDSVLETIPCLESGYVSYIGLNAAWRTEGEQMASAQAETEQSYFDSIDVLSDMDAMVEAMAMSSGGGAGQEIPEDGTEQEAGEYDDLAFANVSRYVNIRSAPDVNSKVVGKMYNGAVAHINAVAGEDGDWFQISSGSVEGYIKAEFFIYGEAAADAVDEYVTRYAQVQTRRLNVRREPSMEARRIGYVDEGERVRILEDCGEWLRVQYTDEDEGYVAAEYVSIAEEFTYAVSIEEEKAALAAQKALKEREQATEQAAPEVIQNIVFPQTAYTSNEELRKAIIEYAMQYLGNSYVSGGKSLAKGTDCSGFTCFIYADFGYSISRTPAGQLSSAGRSIDYSEIQPGDIICYSSKKGKACTHVGLYIGDGQIIHSANSRKGVIISRADFEPIVGIKNVID